MKRTILDPRQAAWLDATFARNRARFGGLQMMADEPDGGEGGDDGGKPDDPTTNEGGKSGDEPLGEAGKKALDSERAARKAAEDRVKAMETEFGGFKKALTEGLGLTSEDGDKGGDALAQLQAQFAAMQQETSVLRAANEHKITDPDDLALLATAKDADALQKLAERLAPSDDTDSDAKSHQRKPKPDRTQGGGSGGADEGSGVAHGRDLFKASRKSS